MNKIIWYKKAFSIIFHGGPVLISTVNLATSHTLSGKWNIHVVPGFSWNIPTYSFLTNMEFLNHHRLDVFREIVWQKRTFLGVHTAYIYFIFMTHLWIFIPLVEILLVSCHYFLVNIFKYHTSSRFNYGLEFRGTVIIPKIFAATAQKREQHK